MKIIKATLLILSFTFVSACTSIPGQVCHSDQAALTQESIYFGTGKKDGYVTSSEWSAFLDKTVTPKFPDGLTVTEASGQWKGNDGMIVKEPSYVLTIIHDDSKANSDAIVKIMDTYKTQFQQESVLRVTSKACVSF